MSILKKVLGIHSHEVEQKDHRESLKQALERQSKASERAEATLVDLLKRVQTIDVERKD